MGRVKAFVAIEIFKRENQCKTTFSLKFKFRKAGIIIIGENRDISSVHSLPWDAICVSLISLEVSLGASMIQECLDILHYIRE